MNWTDAISDNLPAPRDDEPASLRRDIADELADHLQCAVRRETLINPDADLARRKALDRFGNPQQIARQLWFDALKEKIMSQRLMLAVTVVLAITCLTATGMTWLVVNQGRAAAEAMAAESRAANAALLAQIAKMNAPATAPLPLEWNKVQVQLITPDRAAKAPEGTTVTLLGHVLDAAKETTINATISADGLADFGLVRAGRHSLTVRTGWNEITRRSIDVRPGQSLVEEIVCPAAAPGEAEIKATVDWPEDLRDKSLWLICELLPRAQLSSELASRAVWSISPPGAHRQILAISPTGALVNFTELAPSRSRNGGDFFNALTLRSGLINSRSSGPSPSGFGGSYGRVPTQADIGAGLVLDQQLTDDAKQRSAASTKANPFRANPTDYVATLNFGIPKQNPTPTVRWSGLVYQLNGLIVTTEMEQAPDNVFTQLKVLSGQLDNSRIRSIEEKYNQVSVYRSATMPWQLAELNQSIPPTVYSAVAGKLNEWNIALPEELLRLVREELAKPRETAAKKVF